MATESERFYIFFCSRICKYSLGRFDCDVEEATSPFSVKPGTDEHFPGGRHTKSYKFRKIGKLRMRRASHAKDRKHVDRIFHTYT